MKNISSQDLPIKSPNADLLGTAVYAQRLARYVNRIPWPFTLGVYGEWGEGKTSFVRIFQHYLEAEESNREIEFIEFSAWPYTTASAVWRALGRRVTQCVYKIRPDENIEVVPEAPEEQGLVPALRDYLFRDAVVIRRMSEGTSRQEYQEIIASLDLSAGLVTGRSTPQENSGRLMEVVGQLLLSAAPLFAPWLTLFREIDASGVLNRKVPKRALPVVESVEQTRFLLRQMFSRYGTGRRIVVFIDDLDRCLPEVALEVLEALKIFLAEVPCLFIVAADQNLIGEGLRSRYHRVLGPQWGSLPELARKGREYFEKIVQFGVHMPICSKEKLHFFVASQFPEWACASDILQVMADTNPRRIKQVCNILSYKFLVSAGSSNARTYGQDALELEDVLLLNKLIQCQTLSPDFLRSICTEASDAASSSKVLAELERIEPIEEDKYVEIMEASGATVSKQEKKEESVNIFALCAVLKERPLFSECSHDRLLEFAEFADIRPQQPLGVWRTRDRVLLRFLRDVALPGGPSDPETVLRLDFARVLEVVEEFPDVAEALRGLAECGSRSWTREMFAIEQWLQGLDESHLAKLRVPAANTLVERIGSKLEEDGDKVRRIFSREPRFSSTLYSIVEAYWEIQRPLPNPSDLLNRELLATTPIEAQRRRVAQEAVRLLDSSIRERILDSLRRRQRASVYLLEHRKFAKLEALTRGWPAIAKQVLQDGDKALRALESLMVPGDTPPTSWPSRWSDYQNDERLRRLFLLQPAFTGIGREERDDFLAEAETFSMLSQAEGGGVSSEGGEEEATAQSVVAVGGEECVSLKLQIKRAETADVDFILSAFSSSTNSTESRPVTLSLPAMQRIRTELAELFWMEVAARDHHRHDDPIDRVNRVEELGRCLFSSVFGDEGSKVREMVLRDSSLEGDDEQRVGKRFRFLLDVDDQWVNVPWEILYLPDPVRAFPALKKNHSLVRYLPRKRPIALPAVTAPLRILAVLSSPRDAPPLDIEKEVRILERTLASSIRSGSVKFLVLNRPTRSDLMHNLRVFRPHIFHFVGHGVILPHQQQGALVLQDEEGNSEMMGAVQLRTLLTESTIRLAVLNGCETGISGSLDTLTSVAGALVRDGIPAAVATIRPISDRTATLFAQEFYRALVDGYPLEMAVTEGRRALQIERDDWGAYALFSSTDDLESFRIMGRSRENHVGISTDGSS